MEKKDLFPTLLIAVVTAVVSSALTIWVNKVAFDDTKKQAQYEHKVKSIETFSGIAMNMIILFRSMDNVHLMESKLLIKYVKSKHSDNPFTDIKNDTLVNSGTNASVDSIMQKEDTAVYHRYQKASAYLSNYFSAYYSSLSFFGQSTQDSFKKLDTLMQVESYQEEVLSQMSAKKIKSLEFVNWGDIDDSLLKKRTAQLKLVLKSMSDLD